MLWLYLLGIVTFLGIVVRRLWRKQKPLNDEVYSWRVALDHVNSGVGWIPVSGSLHSMNPALAHMLGATAEDLAGSDWLRMFPQEERSRVEKTYRQMLLAGIASLRVATVDSRGVETAREVLLVAVHDHKMRFTGHHCIVERILDDGADGRRFEDAAARVSSPEFATLSS
jgi:PAS domain S-box-containing protein